MGIVTGKNVKIGENCLIRSGCVFGNRKHECNITIGNNCIFGANTVIIGNVKVGNNVKTGANTVILKDIPDNKTIVGVWK